MHRSQKSLFVALVHLAVRLHLEIARAQARRRSIGVDVRIDGSDIPVELSQSGWYWLDQYVEPKEIESIVIHRGTNAWLVSGSASRVEWLVEIARRRYLEKQ